MKPPPEPDPDFESILRQRAPRLAVPDPAWRAEMLENIPVASPLGPRRPRRPIWRTKWFPASLAASWLVIPLLNWSADRETRRFAQYANAQAVPEVLGGFNQTVLLAAASGR